MLSYVSNVQPSFKAMRPRQNYRHFADNIFKGISVNENVWIVIKVPLTFVVMGVTNDMPV